MSVDDDRSGKDLDHQQIELRFCFNLEKDWLNRKNKWFWLKMRTYIFSKQVSHWKKNNYKSEREYVIDSSEKALHIKKRMCVSLLPLPLLVYIINPLAQGKLCDLTVGSVDSYTVLGQYLTSYFIFDWNSASQKMDCVLGQACFWANFSCLPLCEKVSF